MAIEKLNNNGDILDMTAPPKVDIPTPAKAPKPKESVIDMTPKTGKMKVTTSGGSRNKVSITDLKGEEKEVHGNPNISQVAKEADDILDLTNPNSDFNQYYNNKVKEYNERMQEEEDRVRDAVEAGELDPNSEVAKSWLGDPEEVKKGKTVRTADIDFGDEEEEEDDMADNIDDIEFDELPGEESVEAPVEEEEEEESLLEDFEDEEESEEEAEEDDYEDTDIDDMLKDEEVDEEEEDDPPAPVLKEVKKTDTGTVHKKKTEASALSNLDLSIKSKKVEIEEDEEEEEDEDQKDDDELTEKLRRMATEKLRPKSAVVDISNFAIGKASVKNINPVLSIKENKIAKWVLINQDQVVFMREFSGVELQTFVDAIRTNSASNFSRRMRMIYNHIENPDKPSFEVWMKSTPYSDIDHYYFGVYIASFNGANYMPIDCAGGTKCPEGTFVSDDIPIMDMVKFSNDKIKNRFKKIYKEETMTANPEGKFIYNIVPINNSIAVGFREPMLYDFIESVSVADDFARKYAAVIDLAPYIDRFYIINQETGTLDPVDHYGKNDSKKNAAKAYRAKIRKFNTLLSYLNPDEYSMVEACAKDIREKEDGIKYVIPALTCPYCGTESAESEMNAETLVFTRYQLGVLVNTTLK